MNSRLIVLIALSCPSQIGTAVKTRIGEGMASRDNNKSGIQETRKARQILFSWFPDFLIKLLFKVWLILWISPARLCWPLAARAGSARKWLRLSASAERKAW